MANNINQSSFQEEEIDIREIIKVLIESKKLIILTTLIFTVVSIVYSLSQKPEFKSSSFFEIGYYEMLDGANQLLDTPEVLINDLTLNLIMKNPDNEFNQAVSMKPLQEKLIQFETTSLSSEKNEKLLNKFFSYIDNHHASLMKSYTDNNRNDLHNQIDLIESEISELSKIIADNKNILFILQNDPQLFIDRASISPKLNILTNMHITNVANLVNRKNTILLDIENLNNQKIINGGVIGDIQITTIKPKYLLIITLGIILGFISSIFLVFIRSFIKGYRESKE